ncbi:hypothetical protein [Phytopseudomonas daroniae]|uniref:hypothetical protein n=1 Tax=Phytopseudomonas daroniae TaxID=2487519 RepID=UPI0010383DA5|nr:hypothetical protein [Pseudomonas daroniae]TBU78192.1 hypothetical protein DNK10_00140 [Pseudomonas daroniae]
MKTPAEVGQMAETFITTYVITAECQTAEDLRKACELLISKAARAIEKYNGNPVAVDVLSRSMTYVATNPMRLGGAQ